MNITIKKYTITVKKTDKYDTENNTKNSATENEPNSSGVLKKEINKPNDAQTTNFSDVFDRTWTTIQALLLKSLCWAWAALSVAPWWRCGTTRSPVLSIILFSPWRSTYILLLWNEKKKVKRVIISFRLLTNCNLTPIYRQNDRQNIS